MSWKPAERLRRREADPLGRGPRRDHHHDELEALGRLAEDVVREELAAAEQRGSRTTTQPAGDVEPVDLADRALRDAGLVARQRLGDEPHDGSRQAEVGDDRRGRDDARRERVDAERVAAASAAQLACARARSRGTR